MICDYGILPLIPFRLLRDGRSLSAPFGLLSESLASTSSLMMKLLDGDVEDVPRISNNGNSSAVDEEGDSNDITKEQEEKEEVINVGLRFAVQLATCDKLCLFNLSKANVFKIKKDVVYCARGAF